MNNNSFVKFFIFIDYVSKSVVMSFLCCPLSVVGNNKYNDFNQLEAISVISQ